MSQHEHDQYLTAPFQPAFSLQPPTPLSMWADAPYTVSSSASTSTSPSGMPMPIPISSPSSRAPSRVGTPTSASRSGSARHHPYSASPASHSERPLPLFRPRSATSASDHSAWDSEASSALFDASASSVDSYSFTPASSCDVPSSRPSTSSSPYVADGPAKIGPNGRPVKSHSRKQAPGHIKRPPNAFILFRSHCCAPESVDPSLPEPPGTAQARYLASLEINNSQHISMIVSQVWNQLKPEGKAYWEEKARLAKEEHQRLHPEYRYRPQQRPKEAARRRKKAEAKMRHSERNACTEVAQQVLKLDSTSLEPRYDSAFALERDRLSYDSVSSGLPTPHIAQDLEVDVPVAPSATARKAARQVSPARKTRTRRAPANPRAKANAKRGPSSASAPPTDDVCTIQLETMVAAPGEQASYLLPPGAPPTPGPSLLSRQLGMDHPTATPLRASYGRRTRLAHTAACDSPEDEHQFNYVAALNSYFDSQLPPATSSSFAIDPRLENVTAASSLPHAGYSLDVSPFDSHYSLDTSRSVPPNECGAGPHSALCEPGTSQSSGAHDEAFSRMRSYTLGAPSSSVSSTSSFVSTMGDLPKANDLLADRRAAQLPAPLDALQQRRGTIRASDIGAGARGDLMLISPLTTTFQGRRQSLGWQNTLRRVSLVGDNVTLPQTADGLYLTPAAPLGRRSSLATGVISAQELETVTFSQELLESIPAEDSTDFFSQFTFYTQAADANGMSPPEDESERPSTATSSWSDEGIERLEADYAPGFFDRRRSTIVASSFVSAFSSAAGSPNSQGYHVGSSDFFVPPGPALSTASTSAAFTRQPTPSTFGGVDAQQSPAFGSAGFGGSFRPYEHDHALLTENTLAAASRELSDNCNSGSGLPGELDASADWLASTQHGDGSSDPAHSAALSVLNERRQQGSTSPGVSQSGHFVYGDSVLPLQGSDCTYVCLTIEQMKDERLLNAIRRAGYGIAIICPSADVVAGPALSSSFVPSVGNLRLGSPSSAHSVL